MEEKIAAKHGLAFDEITEVFLNQTDRPLIVRSKKEIKSRWRYAALGRTFSGKYITVIFVMEKKHVARVITARMMSGTEKRRYQR
ncbi:MAG: BrnT family toxin [PVC group bacterium]